MKRQLALVARIFAGSFSLAGKKTKYGKHVAIVLAVVVTLQASPLAWGDFTDGGFEPGDAAGSYGGNVNVVEYEYVNDFLGLSQPPYTTGPDGTPAWRPTEGNYFLSMKDTTEGASMQFHFSDRPAGDPLSFSFDWFFDFGGLKPDEGDRYDVSVQVFLTARWGFFNSDFTETRLIAINESVPAEVMYALESDENVGWSRLSLPLADMPLGGPPMNYEGSIEYILEVIMYSPVPSGSILGFDNITLGPASVVPLPGALVVGSLGLGFAGWKLQRRKEL